MKQPELELRSTVVQEILGYVPHWMIRWGITVCALLLTMGIFIAWLIQYPDVLAGQGRLTSVVPPITLHATQQGTLARLCVSDNALVAAQTPLAEIKSDLSEPAIAYLKKWISWVEKGLVNHFFSMQHHDPTHLHTDALGAAQEAYNALQIHVQQYINTFQNSHHRDQCRYITHQIACTKSLLTITHKQLGYAKRIEMQEKIKFSSYQKLYQQKKIAQLTLFTQETQLLRASERVADIEQVVIQHRIALEQQQNQLNETIFNHQKEQKLLEATIRNALQSLQKEVMHWQQNYQLVAPFSGRVCYLNRWAIAQQVQPGQPLFAIVPKDEQYVVELYLPSTGYGKIATGQLARIQLPAYPEQEYGYLRGIVAATALVPHANTYRVTLTLPNGLTTNYKKTLVFKPNMECTAEIITEDMRLLTRIGYQLMRYKNK